MVNGKEEHHSDLMLEMNDGRFTSVSGEQNFHRFNTRPKIENVAQHTKG